MNRHRRFLRTGRVALLGGMLLLGLGVRSEAYTLIVSPARYSVLQVAFDILNRSPSVLVSYQGEGSTAEPILYAWNGSEWVLVSLKDYREVNFLQRVPDQTVLIGSDDLLPASLVEASSWSPKIVRVRDLDTSSLINEMGHLLNWRDSDWQWFAARYNLKLQDEAEPRRGSSWYDQPGPIPDRPRLLPRRAAPAASREPQPVPVVTVAPVAAAPIEEEAQPAAPAEASDAVSKSAPEAAPDDVKAAPLPASDAIDRKTEDALSVFGDPDASVTK